MRCTFCVPRVECAFHLVLLACPFLETITLGAESERARTLTQAITVTVLYEL